jgi:aminoglycoside 6'-N-acetyltransferase I
MVELRIATSEDLTVLVKLARAFYDEDGFATTDAELHRNFEVLLRSADARLVIAVEGDEPVGFALSTVAFTLESGVIVELQDLYVVPSARTGGVGSTLIEDADAWARSRGATLLEVVVAPNGADVTHLLEYYRRRGFADEGRRLLARRLLEDGA